MDSNLASTSNEIEDLGDDVGILDGRGEGVGGGTGVGIPPPHFGKFRTRFLGGEWSIRLICDEYSMSGLDILLDKK